MDQPMPTDVAILDLLRERDEMTVVEFAAALQVTATAVRQRLNRLMGQGFVAREATSAGRGRPCHRYCLTEQGQRQTGANFADLAMALWQEMRAIEDPEVRRGLLRRIAGRLASAYKDRVRGATTREKMEAVAELFQERKVPFAVSHSEQLPVLTALACPYPVLAEQDRTICAVERMLFSELLGENVHLGQCRLDGASCCTFELN